MTRRDLGCLADRHECGAVPRRSETQRLWRTAIEVAHGFGQQFNLAEKLYGEGTAEIAESFLVFHQRRESPILDQRRGFAKPVVKYGDLIAREGGAPSGQQCKKNCNNAKAQSH